MSVLAANCPSCAGPIEFKAGSTLVLICPYCRSAVARTDRGLSDLGKVAEIAESESPLKLGLKGIFNGNRFELTGRAQLKHVPGCAVCDGGVSGNENAKAVSRRQDRRAECNVGAHST